MDVNDVLIVHSDEQYAEEISSIINLAGYNTFIATNKEDAIYTARQYPLHVIVINALLTDTSMIEIITQIRMISHLKNTPIILLAETDGAYNEIKAISKETSRYGSIQVVKLPGSEEELVSIINLAPHTAQKVKPESNDSMEDWNAVKWDEGAAAPGESPLEQTQTTTEMEWAEPEGVEKEPPVETEAVFSESVEESMEEMAHSDEGLETAFDSDEVGPAEMDATLQQQGFFSRHKTLVLLMVQALFFVIIAAGAYFFYFKDKLTDYNSNKTDMTTSHPSVNIEEQIKAPVAKQPADNILAAKKSVQETEVFPPAAPQRQTGPEVHHQPKTEEKPKPAPVENKKPAPVEAHKPAPAEKSKPAPIEKPKATVLDIAKNIQKASGNEPPKTSKSPETHPAGGYKYAAQAGFFGVENNAATLVKTLKEKGIENAFVRPETSAKGTPMFRVLAGPYDTPNGAAETVKKIKDAGVMGAVTFKYRPSAE